MLSNSVIPRLLVLLLVLSVLVPVDSASAIQNQTDADLEAVARLIPADATALVSINTDAASEQLVRSLELLEVGGLEPWYRSALNALVSASDLPPSLLDPSESTLLGGRITLATWGSDSDPVSDAALYLQTTDADSAWRTLVGLVIGDVLADSVSTEIPGGRAAYDDVQSVAVMQFDEIVVVAPVASAQVIMQLVMGSEPVLAEFRPYRRVISAQDDSLIALAYLNGPIVGFRLAPLLMDTFNLSFDELSFALAITGPLVTAHSTLGLRAGDQGFELHLAQLPAPFVGQPLPPDGPDEDLAKLVSQDVDVFIAGADLGEQPIALQAADAIVSAIAGATGALSPTFDEGNAGQQRDDSIAAEISAQIMEQLRGDFLFAADVHGLHQASDATAVLVSDLEDPGAIDGLLLLLQLALESDDQAVLDVERNSVSGGSLLSLTTVDRAGQPVSVQIGVVDDQLVVGFMNGYTALLDPLDGQSLADSGRYQFALDAAAEDDATTLYLDVQTALDMVEMNSWSNVPDDVLRDIGLGNFAAMHSLVAQTWASDGLAITDIRLVIDEQVEASTEGTTVAPIEITNAEQIDTDLYILSVSPSGEYALAQTKEATCLVSTRTWLVDDQLCTEEVRQADRNRVAWSPDGSSVAFTEDALVFAVDSDLYVIEAEARRVRNLTDDGYDGSLLSNDDPAFAGALVDTGPVWSPDGSQVAFTRTALAAEEGATSVLTVHVETGALSPEFVVFESANAGWGGAIWTEESGLVMGLYSVDLENGANGIYRINLETGDVARVATPGDQPVAVLLQPANDETVLVAYPQVLNQMPKGDQCGWAMLDLETGVFNDVLVDGACVTSAGVSPDGDVLIVSAMDGPLLAVVDPASGEWAEVETDLLEPIIGDRSILAGANQSTGANAIPWTQNDALWFTQGAGTLVWVGIAEQD